MSRIHVASQLENPFMEVLPGEFYHGDEGLRRLVPSLYDYLQSRNPGIGTVLEVGASSNTIPYEMARKRGWRYIGVDDSADYRNEPGKSEIFIRGDIMEEIKKEPLSYFVGNVDLVLFWASGVHTGGMGNWSVYQRFREKLNREKKLKRETEEADCHRMGRDLYVELSRFLSDRGAIVETNLGYARHFSHTYFSIFGDISGEALQKFVPVVSDLFSEVEILQRDRKFVVDDLEKRVERELQQGPTCIGEGLLTFRVERVQGGVRIHTPMGRKDATYGSVKELLENFVSLNNVTDAVIFWK